MILCIGIFGNNLFIILVSTLTFFKFWFLRDDYVVLFSVMNFFNNLIFISSSCVNFCFLALRWVTYQLSFFFLRFNSVRAFFFSVFRGSNRVGGSF